MRVRTYQIDGPSLRGMYHAREYVTATASMMDRDDREGIQSDLRFIGFKIEALPIALRAMADEIESVRGKKSWLRRLFS